VQIRGLKKPRAGEEENKNAQAGRAGCVWVHPQKGLNNLILNLVHWWLLVHSSLSIAISNSCPTLKNNSTLESWWAFNSFHFQFSVEVK
jgi:hypothetical protein